MKGPEGKGWSPYLAGALTGLVIILAALIEGKYFGTSASFVRTAAMIENFCCADKVEGMLYFKRFMPVIDWQWMFVAGILLGSFISAITSNSFRIKAIPDMWEKRFGSNKLKRGLVAFIGGAILMFGARLASGCPSGHGMGTLVQLGVNGLIAIMCFFAGGIIVALILYPGRKSQLSPDDSQKGIL